MSNNSKFDALFIFPPLTLYERYGERKVGNVGGFLPPLGISYIASYIRQSGYKVGVIDALSLQMTEEEIINAIKARDPKVIGLSSLTPMFNRAVQLSKKIREYFPEKLIIIGGQHATIMTSDVLSENECFDVVVCGEGENAVLELMNSFRACNYDKEELLGNADCLLKIKGIAFRNSSTIVQNPPSEHIKNLDILPFPAWDLLPMEKYIPLPNQYLR
ncbi:MAG TPA: cobalamin-dependent protein [Candidatus Parcubacteria bacterium]|nr:cobalamin-dependent protein [Candidatus Parcubacteria bacterium]